MNRNAIWRVRAERILLAERDAAPRTPLVELPLPARPGQRLVFKDESVHPTGSLKHRLARSLLLHALRGGRIDAGTPLFEASSGNTAVSEAAFAKLLGLPYFAVIPASTTTAKQALIRASGGECVLIEPGRCCKEEAARLAAANGGCFLDQFTNAAIATDWRKDNLVTELFEQLHEGGLPVPDWFVSGAGTGGTATCAGRFFRNTNRATRLLVVDPEDSAFFGHFDHAGTPSCLCASRVEGIGRPTVEPSFDGTLVDRMVRVPDAASYAAARWLSRVLEKPVGLSTGTNLIGAISLLQDRDCAFVATLVCDDGERYADRLDNERWLAAQGLDLAPWIEVLDAWHATGDWHPPAVQCCETSSRTFA